MLLSKHRCKGKVAQLFFPLGSRLFWPRLLFGPRQPPKTRRGKFLFCERRGTVKVGDYSDGPIPWPLKWGTRNSLILCGDLVRAVRGEAALAIARHWGVRPTTVRGSRRRGQIPKD